MRNTISGHGFVIREPENTSDIERDDELVRQKLKEFELVISKIRTANMVLIYFDKKRLTRRHPLRGIQIIKVLKRKPFKWKGWHYFRR